MAHPKYIAHAESSSHRIQSLETHLKNVETLGIRNNPLPEIKNLVHLMLILHDAGKVSDDFQDYMETVLKDSTVKRHVDHSSTGGKIIEGFDDMPLLSNIVANIIYMHHGLADCIDFKGATLTERRDQSQIDFETIEEKFFEIFSASEIRSIAEEANKEVLALYDHIKKYAIKYIEINKTDDAKSVKISVAKFCIGMYTRLLLSILIDSDWTDAACFSDDIPLPERMTLQEVMQIWQRSSRHLNKHMQQFKKDDSIINAFRRKISDICYQKSIEPERIYRLTVPTGAGKTLSSLRFALNHAIKYKKQHIIYVAPYNSILEQNADEIRQAVGDKNIVLEHHSNVVISENESESEMNEKKYKKLTESWDMPIIATSAVQILNTLFSSKKECIRRMYNLCNSIIVFDEVQAIPSKCSNLFNLAVNWLSECCHTTVVLCSATQPSLAGNQTYNVFAAEEMAGDPESYTKLFQRVEIHDKTSDKPGGMEVNDVIELISDSMQEYQSVLMIVNTKKAALSIFQAINKKYEGTDTAVIHLSTFMCPKHRKEKIDLIKQYLNDHKKIICISTQIIEAGVNLSFGCVIRSLAGLDNILQAAGRCNRDGKMDKKASCIL